MDKRILPMERIPRGAWLAALLCLGINLAIFAGVAVRRPEYLHDFHLCKNPDAPHHVLLGRNFLLTGHYSRCEQPPFPPDMLRPPVYPLFAGSFDLLGGAGAIYLAHALLQAGSCLLLYRLTRRAFGDRAALFACLFLATDLMLAVFNFESMSEPLFIFLTLAALTCVVPVLTAAEPIPGRTVRLLGGGLLLGLAMLTRPVALYLAPLLFLAFLGLGAWRRQLLSALGHAALFLLAAALPVTPWIVRNQLVFGVPRLSTVDAGVQVYFLGAGAYEVRHRVELEEAQEMIAREYRLDPYVVTQNPWRSEHTVAELDAELRHAAPRVLRKYPPELAQAMALGIAKASFSHNVDEFAGLLGSGWSAPGTGALLRGRPEAVSRLLANGALLCSAFAWQMLHVLATLLLAAAGIGYALRRPAAWPAAGVLLAVLAYFYLTVALFGLEAFCRCRIPVLPYVYVFSGWGLACLTARRPAAPQAA